MKNDQWFEPGDKVMRVSAINPEPDVYAEDGTGRAPYGQVFCVSACWKSQQGPTVMRLVGVQIFPWCEGIFTANFRKVEEIKLCVAAAEKAKQLTPQHA